MRASQVIGQSVDPTPQLWLVLSNGNLSCIKMANTDVVVDVDVVYYIEQ